VTPANYTMSNIYIYIIGKTTP